MNFFGSRRRFRVTQHGGEHQAAESATGGSARAVKQGGRFDSARNSGTGPAADQAS
jgi:hypothetical protein